MSLEKTNIVECRVEFLEQLDFYIRDVIGDDNITDYWLTYGLPDGYTNEDLTEIATDDNAWLEMITAFQTCCKMAEVI